MDVVDEWTSMYAPVPGSYHGMSGTWFFDAASETGLFFNAAGDLSTGFKFRPGQVSQFPYVKN